MKKALLLIALSLSLCLTAVTAGCSRKGDAPNGESSWSDENADVDGWT